MQNGVVHSRENFGVHAPRLIRIDAHDPDRVSPEALLKYGPELQLGIMQLEREGSPPPGLRLPQAKLSRKSNQVARGRIRRFESYMPSHAVGLHVPLATTEKPRGMGAGLPAHNSLVGSSSSWARAGVGYLWLQILCGSSRLPTDYTSHRIVDNGLRRVRIKCICRCHDFARRIPRPWWLLVKDKPSAALKKRRP